MASTTRIGPVSPSSTPQAKNRYLGMFAEYKRSCTSGLLFPGSIHFWRNSKPELPDWIANFPTKVEWRDPSRLVYIEKGLPELVRFVRATEIESIAIPPLGCGLGGLDFADVRPLIEQAFKTLPDVRVYVYQP